MTTDSFTLPTLNFHAAERLLVEEALRRADGGIMAAAEYLGLTRHAVKRRIVKHGIKWSRSSRAALPETAAPS